MATELFGQTGYRGTAIAEVAIRAGLTLPGLLHHFGSKEALLLAVIEQRDADSEAYATELLGREGQLRLPSIPDFAGRNKERPGLAKLFTVLVAESLEPNAPGHEHFVDRYRALRAIVADMIIAGQQDGRVRKDIVPKLKAAEILATLDGLQTQWLLDPDEVDIVESASAYAENLERDLTAGL
ncbi:TetR/AcrR family transcriptional regulator [Fodinicola feengrottensis]|uniref:TetR/AcrR family transcriptional regulator n=1 Tax=Fodinicola feengrottensis TaxID=435914 RepID=A0ABN2J6H6_9ACTN